MAQLPDIRVRKGAGRPHRTSLALDRLREREDPTTLRVVVQANLPRGQGRPSRLEYQRVGSWLIDCRNPADVVHVREELAHLMHTLSGPGSPAQEAIAQAPALGDAEDDPELKKFFQRLAEIRGQAPGGNPARESRPPEARPPMPTPLTIEDRDPWQRLRLF